PNRGLVHGHHTLEARHRSVDQRTLTRARHSGDDNEHTTRDVDIDILQVVRARAADFQRAIYFSRRLLEPGPGVEMPAGQRAAPPQPVDGALEHHLATGGAGTGP